MDEFNEQLEWLVNLMNPHREAWKAHCWHEANRYARECPEIYAGLPAALKARMQTDSNKSTPAQPSIAGQRSSDDTR